MIVRARRGIAVAALLVGMSAPVLAEMHKPALRRYAVAETANDLFIGHGARARWQRPDDEEAFRVAAFFGRKVQRDVKRALNTVGIKRPVWLAIEPAQFLSIADLRWGFQVFTKYRDRCQFEWRATLGGKELIAGEGIATLTRRDPVSWRGSAIGDMYRMRLVSLQLTHVSGSALGIERGQVNAQFRKLLAPRRAAPRVASVAGRGR